MNKTVNQTEFIFANEIKEYTIVPNSILRDKRISFKALGIYAQILQFRNSPSHKIYIQGLTQNKTDGRDSVSSGVQELIACGYLRRIPILENGRFSGVKYLVYMNPSLSNTKHFYDEYLQSSHWQQVRVKAVERAGGKCQLCSSTEQLNVHHNNYDHLWNESPKDVVVLCKGCHEKFHGIENVSDATVV